MLATLFETQRPTAGRPLRPGQRAAIEETSISHRRLLCSTGWRKVLYSSIGPNDRDCDAGRDIQSLIRLARETNVIEANQVLNRFCLSTSQNIAQGSENCITLGSSYYTLAYLVHAEEQTYKSYNRASFST